MKELMRWFPFIFLFFLTIERQIYAQIDDENDPIAKIIVGTRTTSLGCGARAVYLLLAAEGYPEKLSDIDAVVDPNATGICTAADIIKYFHSLSMNARLVTCNYDDLLTTREKIILILKNTNIKGVMHFAFAIVSKERELEMVDPTLAAEPTPVTKEWLEKRWNGYALLVENH